MDTVSPHADNGNTAPKTTCIYVLIDPETNEVRYVGKTNYPKARLGQHIRYRDRSHRHHWIQSLTERGLKPLFQVIEEVPLAIWPERELFWIEHYLRLGHPLTNTYFGSEGVSMVSPEVRAKMSASHKGKPGNPHTPESKAKLSAARKGKPGHPSTPETNAKISASRKGKKRDPRIFSEEWRRRKSEALRGRKQSPEHVAKRIASQKGKPFSPERRAAISMGRKRGHAMRKASQVE